MLYINIFKQLKLPGMVALEGKRRTGVIYRLAKKKKSKQISKKIKKETVQLNLKF